MAHKPVVKTVMREQVPASFIPPGLNINEKMMKRIMNIPIIMSQKEMPFCSRNVKSPVRWDPE